MNEKVNMRRALRTFVCIAAIVLLIFVGGIRASANEYEDESLPSEYADFIGSIDGSVSDKLPDSVFSDDPDALEGAATELATPSNVLSVLVGLLSEGLQKVSPTLAILLGIVILCALVGTVASNCGGLSRSVECCTRLCMFCAISGVAVSCVETLSVYFERLFAAVASFLPLSAALFAMGGNLNAAASNSASLGVVLAVCEFFCTKTVIPVFCVCLCLSVLSAFDGVGASAGGAVGATVRKWYMTALSFVMMILTVSLGASNLLAVKADNMAMRGAKFAVSSFIPVSGGTLSSTLGTLSASVELLRGSVGVIGIVILLLLLLPTVIELALLRGVFTVSSFCASTLGCHGEAKLLSELESLYGYLEGVAALSAAVFIIAFAIFASVATPFS